MARPTFVASMREDPAALGILALGLAASLALLYALAGLENRHLALASLAVAFGAGAIARSLPRPWRGFSAAWLALALFALGAALETGAVLARALGLTLFEMLAALDAELVFSLWWERRSTLARGLVPAAALFSALLAALPLSARRQKAP
jgi:hypothetical protein